MQTSAGAERGGSWNHTALGILAELLGTPSHCQATLGKPGIVLMQCLEIRWFSALAGGAGTGPATLRCKVVSAG